MRLSRFVASTAGVVVVALLGTTGAGWPCTCANKTLCLPLQTAPPKREVWAFAIGPEDPSDPLGRSAGFFNYNWDMITSVNFPIDDVSNDALRNRTLCWAHQHQARVILTARGPWSTYCAQPPAPECKAQKEFMSLVVTNKTMRQAYFKEELDRVWNAGADGLNFDVEGAEAVPYHTAPAFVRFFKELREASVARGFKHFQISIDNPIYAGQPQLAVAYNLSGLAKHIDFFMPMGYDMNGMGTIVRNIGGCFKQKEVTAGVPNFCMLHGIMNCSDGSPCTAYPGGPCTGFGGDGSVASANSPLPGLKMAMQQYADQGVSMDKIVLGLPWYGYDYACTNDTIGAPCSTGCKGKQNSNCSGKVWNTTIYNKKNVQVMYRDALKLLRNASTELTYDPITTAYHFDYICPAEGFPVSVGQKTLCTPGRHQVWIDTPASLSIKYSWAASLGVRGVFTWTAGGVDYKAGDNQAKAMWDALEIFAHAPDKKG